MIARRRLRLAGARDAPFEIIGTDRSEASPALGGSQLPYGPPRTGSSPRVTYAWVR
jgi:hypothetical protein